MPLLGRLDRVPLMWRHRTCDHHTSPRILASKIPGGNGCFVCDRIHDMHEDRRSEPSNILLTNRKKRFIQVHHNKFLIDQQQALVAGRLRNIEDVPNDSFGAR